MCCYLTVFSETGFPHSAVMLEVDGKMHWLGFTPKSGYSMSPFSWNPMGRVQRTNREKDINHYVRFKIDCWRAREVLHTLVPRWAAKYYFMTMQDCVSFSSEVAEMCGLSTNSIDMTPYGFLVSLAMANTYTDWNTKPYPWSGGTTTAPPVSANPTAPPVSGNPFAPQPVPPVY